MFRNVSLALLLPVLACAGGESEEKTGDGGAGLPDLPVDDDPGDDSGDVVDEEIVLPPGLNGTVVDPRLPAPEFVATNYDGSTRTRSDLEYRPTVMWFYPVAGTPG